MGNVIPCGGTSRRNSGTGVGPNRGSLLSANLNSSAFVSSTENNGKSKQRTPTGISPSTPVNPGPTTLGNRKRSEHIYLRHLRVRRPKIRALVVLQKYCRVYDAAKWALDRLGVDTVDVSTTDAALSAWNARRESTAAGSSQLKESIVPNLVILDTRNKQQIDADVLARSVRNSVHGEHVVMVAIVKKSSLEREDIIVEAYLQAGFNRVIFDSGSRGYWLNELFLLLYSDVDTSIRLQCADTLFTALDHCRDIVQITDNQDKFIYGNLSGERVLGFAQSELIDRNLWDLQSPVGLSEMVLAENDSSPTLRGSDLVRQKLEHGKPWEGTLNCKRRTGDQVPLETRALPVSFSLSSKRSPDHIVYLKQAPTMLRDDDLGSRRRGSRASRPSYDSTTTTSQAYETSNRRSSSAKIPSMSIQAPITRVINLIIAAQENSPNDVAQALDKVIDILQTSSATDLFSPELEREKNKRTDPVANDLLGALLSNSSREIFHGRRGSAELAATATRTGMGLSAAMAKAASSVAVTAAAVASNSQSVDSHKHTLHNHHHHHHTSKVSLLPPIPDSPPAKNDITEEIREALNNNDKWEFDILNLEKISDHRCLMWLGMSIMLRFDIHKTLSCSENTLQNWLNLIEVNYKRSNAYHNSTHAADVLHATAFFLEQDKLKDMCDGVDEAVCIIAAVIHDVDHPGKNSAFLCNSGSELANLYNDITVLENHHAALGFRLTTSDDKVNIFKNIDRDSYKLIRQGVIDLVLATDMSKHFLHLNKFVSVFSKMQEDNEMINLEVPHPSDSRNSSPLSSGSGSSGGSVHFQNTPENMAILKRMIIKCADVSNPARPIHICKEWAIRIAEEYFTQTDEEKRMGLPVVMPQFDRQTCSIPKSQIGFYDFFINDMFNAWTGFVDLPLLSDYIRSNYNYWANECDKEAEKK